MGSPGGILPTHRIVANLGGDMSLGKSSPRSRWQLLRLLTSTWLTADAQLSPKSPRRWPYSIFFFKINFHWSIVALQCCVCCVCFYCRAEWISHTYTYIPSFVDFLLTEVTTELWVEFSVLHSSFSVSSVAQSCLTLWPHGLQHARPPCPSPTPRACSDSCPLSWWCHPTISSSVVSSSYLQSSPASESFQMSQFFSSGGQSIGVSTSTSVLPMNIQDWFPLGLTGLISLQSKGLSRVFSNTTVQKHQFFSTPLSLYSNSHIHTWRPEKP